MSVRCAIVEVFVLMTTLLAWSFLVGAPREEAGPLFSTLLKAGCAPIGLARDKETCVHFRLRPGEPLLDVEVFTNDVDTHRARPFDSFVVPSHYGKARGEVVTVERVDGFSRQAISLQLEAGTGTGYLEMSWLLVDLDDDGQHLVARAFEPYSGHVGSVHTQALTTTMKWKTSEHGVRLTHTWRMGFGTSEMSSSGGGTVNWTDDLRCSTTCYNDAVEAMYEADDAVIAPRRRLARARRWFATGAFKLHDPATWKMFTLLLDLDP